MLPKHFTYYLVKCAEKQLSSQSGGWPLPKEGWLLYETFSSEGSPVVFGRLYSNKERLGIIQYDISADLLTKNPPKSWPMKHNGACLMVRL